MTTPTITVTSTTQKHIHTHTYTQIYARTLIHTHTHTHTHTYTQTHTHTYTHTHTHTHTYNTHTHTHTQTHRHILTHTHTAKHTHTHRDPLQCPSVAAGQWCCGYTKHHIPLNKTHAPPSYDRAPVHLPALDVKCRQSISQHDTFSTLLLWSATAVIESICKHDTAHTSLISCEKYFLSTNEYVCSLINRFQ
jgi:hypothetical protein